MITSFFSYKVKIREAEFVNEEGLIFSHIAAISFYDKNKVELAYIEVGYVDTNYIYELIDQSKPINLDNCFVENFSLSEYRKSRGIDKKTLVALQGFSARNSFFDAKVITDFSFADFKNKTVNFENAHFISGEVSFNAAVFGNGDANFAYTKFKNGNVDFSNIKSLDGDFIFKNAIFSDGTKDFQYADFGKGGISFVNVEFSNGDVSFINANFSHGEASFKIARFGIGKVDFHYAQFGEGDISFERTEFGNGTVDFSKVEFGDGKVNFNKAVFENGDITFEGSELGNGRITFKRTIFGGGRVSFQLMDFKNADIIFDNADFGSGDVSFFKSKIHVLSLKSCHMDNYFDLRVRTCSYIDLSDTVVRDIIDLEPQEFKPEIKILNFAGMRLLGRIYIDWKGNSVMQMISNQAQTSLRSKAEQFRTLKQNFNVTGKYNDEDFSYVEFKRHEQKADLEDALKEKPQSALWEYPSYVFKWLIFDKMGLYATSPARVLLSVLFMWFFFGLIYIILPYGFDTSINSAVGNPDNLSIVSIGLYHSAITFFTIGYGDCYPYGILRIFSGLEGFTGVFMMSYFTVAFVRKILR